MSTVANQTIQTKKIDVDLSKIYFATGNLTTAAFADAQNKKKQLIYVPFNSMFDMAPNEDVIITDLVINRVRSDSSAAIAASNVASILRAARVEVSAGLNTPNPTLVDANQETLGNVTMTAANVAALNIRSFTRFDLDTVANSLSAKPYTIRNSDLNVGGLVIYMATTTPNTDTAAGTVVLNFSFRKVAN